MRGSFAIRKEHKITNNIFNGGQWEYIINQKFESWEAHEKVTNRFLKRTQSRCHGKWEGGNQLAVKHRGEKLSRSVHYFSTRLNIYSLRTSRINLKILLMYV